MTGRRAILGGLGLGAIALASASLAARGGPAVAQPVARRGGKRMQAGFVAHGAPTLAVDRVKGEPLAAWARGMDAPRAILVVSAHWQAPRPTVGAIDTRPLVYDFYGFPDELYRVTYASPGAPELAARVRELVPDAASVPDRGLDHGAWVPLLHMFPAASVPVLQLAMPVTSGKELFALGQRLAPLRDEGVLVLGSGNVVHNLRRIDWNPSAPVAPFAAEFDAWVADVVARRDWDALADFRGKAPGLRDAHPTTEHLEPLLVAAGAASDGAVTFPVTGFEHGTISRRCVQLG